METIADSVDTETCAETIGSKVHRDLGVHRSAKLSEAGNNILLANLKNNAGASGHVLSDGNEFGKHAAVNLTELFCGGLVQVEHLHSRDFESLLKDSVNGLTSETSSHNVRLNDNTGAVSEYSGGGELAREEKVQLGLFVLDGGGSVDGIAHSVSSKAASDVSAEIFPVINAVFGDNFHSSGDVTLEELSGFSTVLLLDLHEARGSCGGEFSHAQL